MGKKDHRKFMLPPLGIAGRTYINGVFLEQNEIVRHYENLDHTIFHKKLPPDMPHKFPLVSMGSQAEG